MGVLLELIVIVKQGSTDIIDAIGGWMTKGIGHAYGKGYFVDILAKWMRKIDS